MTRRETETMAGLRVVEEAQELLGKMAVSMNRGAYLEGEHVAVLADPEYSERDKTLQVLVTCFAFGHQSVAWENYSIRLRREEEFLPAAYGPLTARGQALLESLSPGTYSLALLDHDDMARELVAIALDPPPTSKTARDAALKMLKALAEKPGWHARSVLIACLDLLCEPSLPAAVRLLASQSFSSDSAIPLRDLDLAAYAAKLSESAKVKEPEEAAAKLEVGLAHAFGFVLSARSLERQDEREVLDALIARATRLETARPIRGAVRTRGGGPGARIRRAKLDSALPVTTRGRASRPPGPAVENPLIVLARTGGARVRNALVALLRVEPVNENLIAELKRVGG